MLSKRELISILKHFLLYFWLRKEMGERSRLTLGRWNTAMKSTFDARKVQHKMPLHTSSSNVWTLRSITKEKNVFQRLRHLRGYYYSHTNNKTVSCDLLVISIFKNFSRKYFGLINSDLWFTETLIQPKGGVEVIHAI